MQGNSKDKKLQDAGIEIIRQFKPIVDEINEAVKSIDPAIKESMAQSLWSVAIGNTPSSSMEAKVNRGQEQSDSEVGSNTGQSDVSTLGGYVQYKNPQTSGQLAVAIAGFHLEEKQIDVVTVEHIKEGLSELGEPIPDRLDTTIRNTSYEGKKLFQKKGKDWKLNFHGQQFLKNHMPIKEEESSKKVVRRKRKVKSAD